MNKLLVEKISAYGNNKLAAEMGVSPQAVSKWAKRGQLPPRRVWSVAQVLGVPADQLSPELYGGAMRPAV